MPHRSSPRRTSPRRLSRDENAEWLHHTTDPLGVYGTRTEQRLSKARQQRAVHRLTALIALAGFAAAAVLFARRPQMGTASGVRVALTQPPGASPIVASDTRGAALLLPTEGGDLQRFDPVSGVTSTLLDTAFPLRATPLVLRNVVFAPCEDGSLYAVDWHTGRALWQHATGSPLSARPAVVEVSVPVRPPLIGEGKKSLILIGNDAGQIRALEAGSGRLVWKRGIGAPVGGGLVAVPQMEKQAPRVLVPLLEGSSGRGGLRCLDARSGAPLWKFPLDAKTPSPQLTPPALDVVGGRVFCGDDSGAMSCVRLSDGARLWKTYARPLRKESQEAVLLRGEPLFQSDAAGERVIVGGNDGVVRCFSAASGQLLWTHNAGFPVRSVPLSVRSEGRPAVLIGCDGPQIWLLDSVTGQAIRKLRTQSSASYGAVAWSGMFYATTSRGSIEKFRF